SAGAVWVYPLGTQASVVLHPPYAVGRNFEAALRPVIEKGEHSGGRRYQEEHEGEKANLEVLRHRTRRRWAASFCLERGNSPNFYLQPVCQIGNAHVLR